MTKPTRFAAPAPIELEADSDTAATTLVEAANDAAPDMDTMHDLFEQWSHWSRTRRYFAPAPSSGNILGKLSSKSRAFSKTGGPDAPCSVEMSALHLAILGQPREALDTRVFLAYYSERAAYIKQAAAELGISRQHFYRLLRAFCGRVHAAAKQIEADNLAARDRLAHVPQSD